MAGASHWAPPRDARARPDTAAARGPGRCPATQSHSARSASGAGARVALSVCPGRQASGAGARARVLVQVLDAGAGPRVSLAHSADVGARAGGSLVDSARWGSGGDAQARRGVGSSEDSARAGPGAD